MFEQFGSKETNFIGQRKRSKLVEIIGTNYGVQLENISGIKDGKLRGKINEHAKDISSKQKRFIAAQININWVSRLEENWYRLRKVKCLQFHTVYVYKWKNHFCKLLNVLGAKDVTQNSARAFEPVILQLSAFEFEVAIQMLKNYHLIDKIPTAEIHAGHGRVRCEIHKRTHLNCEFDIQRTVHTRCRRKNNQHDKYGIKTPDDEE